MLVQQLVNGLQWLAGFTGLNQVKQPVALLFVRVQPAGQLTFVAGATGNESGRHKVELIQPAVARIAQQPLVEIATQHCRGRRKQNSPGRRRAPPAPKYRHRHPRPPRVNFPRPLIMSQIRHTKPSAARSAARRLLLRSGYADEFESTAYTNPKRQRAAHTSP